MTVICKTDIGQKRKTNQDGFVVRAFADDLLLCAVCDGMGGPAGGGEASKTALSAFEKSIAGSIASHTDTEGVYSAPTSDVILSELKTAASDANTAVFRKAAKNAKLAGMGTTLVAVLVYGKQVYGINVGDSRLYYIKGGKARQISHDHSYVQYLIDSGKMAPAEAEKTVGRNIITRAIGIEETVEPDVYVESANGGYLVLCTDGLTNYIEEKEMAKIVTAKKKAVGSTADILISLANERGGADNITVGIIAL